MQPLMYCLGIFCLLSLPFLSAMSFFPYSLDILPLELIFKNVFQLCTVYDNEKLETF